MGKIMTVISFASTKGGAGKTTACILLGTTLASGVKVAMIDADPASRLVRWSQKGSHSTNITVVSCYNEQKIQTVVNEAKKTSDVVLVDLEGVASRLNTFVIAKSDLVIVPTGDEQQDVEDAIGTIQHVKHDSELAGREIKSSVLFTRTKAAVKSRIAKSLNSQMRVNVMCFKTELNDRSAFSNLHNTGGDIKSLPETVGGKEKAIQNAEAFAREVLEQLSSQETS